MVKLFGWVETRNSECLVGWEWVCCARISWTVRVRGQSLAELRLCNVLEDLPLKTV